MTFGLGQAVRVHRDLHAAVGPVLAEPRAARLTALTPHTITSAARLAAEFDRVRRRGWAEAVNERETGVAPIAAPLVPGNVVTPAGTEGRPRLTCR